VVSHKPLISGGGVSAAKATGDEISTKSKKAIDLRMALLMGSGSAPFRPMMVIAMR
jgi:hypothetical protein